MRLKRTCVLFLCLFFLKGYGHALAAAQEPVINSLPARINPCRNSAEFGHSQNQDILFQYAIISENDDDDNAPARKKALTSRFSALNTIFFLSNLSYSSYNNRRLYERLGFLSHDRCIFQRVLKV